jgi:hypothetical protein
MDAKQAQLFTASAAFSVYAGSVLLISDQFKARVPDPYMVSLLLVIVFFFFFLFFFFDAMLIDLCC